MKIETTEQLRLLLFSKRKLLLQSVLREVDCKCFCRVLQLCTYIFFFSNECTFSKRCVSGREREAGRVIVVLRLFSLRFQWSLRSRA